MSLLQAGNALMSHDRWQQGRSSPAVGSSHGLMGTADAFITVSHSQIIEGSTGFFPLAKNWCSSWQWLCLLLFSTPRL